LGVGIYKELRKVLDVRTITENISPSILRVFPLLSDILGREFSYPSFPPARIVYVELLVVFLVRG
jgi:hypothetical protein